MTGVALPKGVVGPAVLKCMPVRRNTEVAVSFAFEIGELAVIVEGAGRLVAEVLSLPLPDREQRQAAAAAEAILAVVVERMRLAREVLVGDASVEKIANERNTVKTGSGNRRCADVLLCVSAAVGRERKKRRR